MVEIKEKEVKKETKTKEKNSKIKNVGMLIKESRKLVTGILAIVVVFIVIGVLLPNERKVITEVESTLKEVVETSKLSTIEYIYNSTVTAFDEDNKEKYYVRYEGTACAGFDLNEIKCEKDDENKQIVIIIPEIEINYVAINDETFDFIFLKEKYNTEKTLQEAYKLCYEDLENKAENNKTIKKMAYESAEDGMRAITLPLESKLPEGYTFDFRKESEVK